VLELRLQQVRLDVAVMRWGRMGWDDGGQPCMAQVRQWCDTCLGAQSLDSVTQRADLRQASGIDRGPSARHGPHRLQLPQAANSLGAFSIQSRCIHRENHRRMPTLDILPRLPRSVSISPYVSNPLKRTRLPRSMTCVCFDNGPLCTVPVRHCS